MFTLVRRPVTAPELYPAALDAWPWKNDQGILVSPLDRRKYRWLQLSNGLQVKHSERPWGQVIQILELKLCLLHHHRKLMGAGRRVGVVRRDREARGEQPAVRVTMANERQKEGTARLHSILVSMVHGMTQRICKRCARWARRACSPVCHRSLTARCSFEAFGPSSACTETVTRTKLPMRMRP